MKKEEQNKIEKIRRVMVQTSDEFESLKKSLIRRRYDFEHVTTGSTPIIKYRNTHFILMSTDEIKDKGYHISKIVKRDVDGFAKRVGANNVVKATKNYKEQMFCLGHIEDVIGKPVVMLDIIGCYWQTAYKLGYITYETYLVGKRKDSWKTGRNASIGGLAKREYITPYVNGKRYLNGRRVVQPKKEYEWARNHIINTVYSVFYRLYECVLGRKFLMFLTDAVVTTTDMAKETERRLWEEGYRCKSKTIEFTKVDRANNCIFWWDYTAIVYLRDSSGEFVFDSDNKKIVERIGKECYYQYSAWQVLEDVDYEC